MNEDLLAIPNWSYSRVRQFERCGFQTLQVNVLKAVTEQEGTAIINGKIVHKIIEDYILKGTPVPKEHDYLLPKIKPYGNLRGNRSVQVHVEAEMAITRQFEPCKWFGREAWGRARCDLLVVQGDAGVLVDFKTGKFSDDAAEQLKLTAVLTFLHHKYLKKLTLLPQFLSPGAPQANAVVVYVDEMATIWGNWMTRLKPLARAYQTNEWHKVPGVQCRWCPVTTCSYHPSRA